MSGSILRWEDPPSRTRDKNARWAPVAGELRQHRFKWACIFEGDSTEASSLVQYVKKGSGPFGPAKAFEACSRELPRVVGEPIKTAVYARFVGAEGGEAA